MSISIETEQGVITVKKEVIARLAGLAVLNCYGIVGMSSISVKDGITRLLKKENLTQGVVVQTFPDNSIEITLHVIVEYSLNLPALGAGAIATVQNEVEKSLGLSVSKVNIVIAGIRHAGL